MAAGVQLEFRHWEPGPGPGPVTHLRKLDGSAVTHETTERPAPRIDLEPGCTLVAAPWEKPDDPGSPSSGEQQQVENLYSMSRKIQRGKMGAHWNKNSGRGSRTNGLYQWRGVNDRFSIFPHLKPW